MAELKTKATDSSVADFLGAIPEERRRRDCVKLAQMMQEATGAEPKMWGPSIVGFGHFHYKYESGRENDWFQVGFAPRKNDLTLYLVSGFPRHEALMKKLGKHKTGKSCLYLKTLDDVDEAVLKELIEESVGYGSTL